MIKIYKEYNKSKKLIGSAKNYVLRGDEGYFIDSEWSEVPPPIVVMDYGDKLKGKYLTILIRTPLTVSNLNRSISKVLFNVSPIMNKKI